MIMERNRGKIAAAIAVMGLMMATALLAHARHPADAFTGRIALSNTSFPDNFSNDDAFIKYIRKHDTREFFPEKEDGGWDFHYMAFFKKPISGSKYLVLFYDVTRPELPILVTQTTSYPGRPGLRIMAGQYELDPMLFKPDKRYLMLYTPSVDAPAIAEAEFVLRPYDAKRAEALREEQAREARRRREEAERAREKAKEDAAKKPQWTPPDW